MLFFAFLSELIVETQTYGAVVCCGYLSNCIQVDSGIL